MGTEFRFGAGENSSAFAVSGLDAQFENSIDLMMQLIRSPSADGRPLNS